MIIPSFSPLIDYEYLIDKLIESEPLGGEMILKLSKYSRHRYIIPFDQRFAKIHSLVLWNATNRPGAQEETDMLADSLHRIGGVLEIVEWSTIAYLQGSLTWFCQLHHIESAFQIDAE